MSIQYAKVFVISFGFVSLLCLLPGCETDQKLIFEADLSTIDQTMVPDSISEDKLNKARGFSWIVNKSQGYVECRTLADSNVFLLSLPALGFKHQPGPGQIWLLTISNPVDKPITLEAAICIHEACVVTTAHIMPAEQQNLTIPFEDDQLNKFGDTGGKTAFLRLSTVGKNLSVRLHKLRLETQ